MKEIIIDESKFVYCRDCIHLRPYPKNVNPLEGSMAIMFSMSYCPKQKGYPAANWGCDQGEKHHSSNQTVKGENNE